MAALKIREKTEQGAAAQIASFLEDRAAELPFDSQLRALALQSAGCWTTIAGQKQQRHLALVTLEEVAEAWRP